MAAPLAFTCQSYVDLGWATLGWAVPGFNLGCAVTQRGLEFTLHPGFHPRFLHRLHSFTPASQSRHSRHDHEAE